MNGYSVSVHSPSVQSNEPRDLLKHSKQSNVFQLLAFFSEIKDLFLLERRIQKEKERQIELPSVGSLLKWWQQPGCADVKPDARSLFLVSHMGARSHGFGPSPLLSQVTSTELDGKWSSQDTKSHPYVIPAHVR